jgi:hypothetical protein
MSTAWRWTGALAAILLGVALAIGVSAALLLSTLPFDHATLVIDGERVSLPPLSGWQAGLALTVALLAVFLVALVAIVIAIAAAAFGVTAAALVVVASLLLVASPLLLVGWIGWLIARRPAKPTRAGGIVAA